MTICWPVASRTIRARVRLRNARLASAGGEAGQLGRAGSTSVVSIRIARLNLPAGHGEIGPSRLLEVVEPAEVGDPVARQPGPPPKSPLCPENANKRSSEPPPLSKTRFQLYDDLIIACPSLNAATENSIGIVGTSVGETPTSKAFRPWLKTLLTTPGAQIRGR